MIVVDPPKNVADLDFSLKLESAGPVYVPPPEIPPPQPEEINTVEPLEDDLRPRRRRKGRKGKNKRRRKRALDLFEQESVF